MRRRLGRRSGAAAAVLFAFLVATPASPAGAAQTITLDQPKAGQVYTEPTVRVSGKVPADLLYKAKDVTLSVKGQNPRTFTCKDAERDCPFSWDLTFLRNGSYEFSVTATTQDLVGLTAGPDIQSPTRTVSVVVPPARPVLDAPKINEARNVELTWSRNAEPDLSYYAVFRSAPGVAASQVGADVKQTASGTKPSLVDTVPGSSGGGEYSYVVYAVRPGVGKDVVSEPSVIRTASVPPPPTTTTSTTPGAVPTTPGATTTTAKPAPPAGVDLSKFLSSRAQPITLPSITVPEPPDTGFEGTLPFGARPEDELEEGELEAVPPRDSGRTNSIVSLDAGRPLVPVAGGLVLLLLALHMRLLNRRVKQAPTDGDLPVVAPPAAATPAPVPPAPAPAPRPPTPAPAPAVFDLYAEDGSEEDWAPGLELDPEPESEPEYEDEEVVTVLAATETEPATTFDPDEIEVVDVVPSRRRLVRAGSR